MSTVDPHHTRRPGEPTPPSGGLGLTTHVQAAAAALGGVVVAYFLIGTLQWMDSPVPVTPWSLPVIFTALATAATFYGRSLKRQVDESRADVTPESGVLALVLGKTLLLTGAIMAGGHALYVAVNLVHFDAPLPRERVVHGTVMIVASLVCAWAGQRLERSCVVPPGSDDENGVDTPVR